MVLTIGEKLEANKELTAKYEKGLISYDTYKEKFYTISEGELGYYNRRRKARGRAIASRMAQRYIYQSPELPTTYKTKAGDAVNFTISEGYDNSQTFTGQAYNAPGGLIAVGVVPQASMLKNPQKSPEMPSSLKPVVPINPVERARFTATEGGLERVTGVKRYYDTSKTTTIEVKPRATPGQYPNTISSGANFKNTTLGERIKQDYKENTIISEIITREATSASYDIDIKTQGNDLARLGGFAARVPLEALKFTFENKQRTLTLIGLGAAVAGGGAAIAGAFPKIAGVKTALITTGISQGAAAIGTSVYVPFLAKGITETSDYAKFTGQRIAEVGLVSLGAEFTKPNYVTKTFDTTTSTRRVSTDKKVIDFSVTTQQANVKSQYVKQTFSGVNIEKQKAGINPFSDNQLVTKSEFSVKGAIVSEPQGISLGIRKIGSGISRVFTGKGLDRYTYTPLDIQGTSRGVIDILPTGYLEGLSFTTQTTARKGRTYYKTTEMSPLKYAEFLQSKGKINLKFGEFTDKNLMGRLVRRTNYKTGEVSYNMQINENLKPLDMQKTISHEIIHYEQFSQGRPFNPARSVLTEAEAYAFESAEPFSVKTRQTDIIKTQQKYFTQSFYKAEADDLGFMRFSGARGSTFGSSGEFRAIETTKIPILEMGGKSITYSTIQGSEMGFTSRGLKFRAQPIGQEELITPGIKAVNLGKLGKSGRFSFSGFRGQNSQKFEGVIKVMPDSATLLRSTGIARSFEPLSVIAPAKSSIVPIYTLKTEQTTEAIQKQQPKTTTLTKIVTIQKPFTRATQKPSQISRNIQIVRPITNEIVLPKSVTKTQQQTRQTTGTRLITAQAVTTITPVTTFNPGATPPQVPPFVPPPVIPKLSLGIGVVLGGGRKRGRAVNQRTKYSPSVKSVLFNIKGKMPKVITPFTPRPISY